MNYKPQCWTKRGGWGLPSATSSQSTPGHQLSLPVRLPPYTEKVGNPRKEQWGNRLPNPTSSPWRSSGSPGKGGQERRGEWDEETQRWIWKGGDINLLPFTWLLTPLDQISRSFSSNRESLSTLPHLLPSSPITVFHHLFFCLFVFSRAAPMAYGGSQARSLIRAVAAGLHQSHSNTGSEPHLQPTPQLTATRDP